MRPLRDNFVDKSAINDFFSFIFSLSLVDILSILFIKLLSCTHCSNFGNWLIFLEIPFRAEDRSWVKSRSSWGKFSTRKFIHV